MNPIVVTECRTSASLTKRGGWLVVLAFSVLALTILACAPSDETPESTPAAPAATAPSDAATPSSQQVPSEAEVVRVIDGLTIEVEHEGERYLVRYLGVSIPAFADSAEALEFNRFIAQGKSVVLSPDDAEVDSDGAHLRYVFIDGEMVNLKLLSGGWGEVAQFPASFEKFEEFFKAESVARSDGRGIWNDEATTPAPSPAPSASEVSAPTPRPTPNPNQDFIGGTLPARPGSPGGGVCDFSGSDTPLIKGNVEQRTGERLYYVPGGLFYTTTAIETEQGDRWFCTEAEAQALGWKPSKR